MEAMRHPVSTLCLASTNVNKCPCVYIKHATGNVTKETPDWTRLGKEGYSLKEPTYKPVMNQSNGCSGMWVFETDTPLETNWLSQQLIRWLEKVGGQDSHTQNGPDNLALQMSRGNTLYNCFKMDQMFTL